MAGDARDALWVPPSICPKGERMDDRERKRKKERERGAFDSSRTETDAAVRWNQVENEPSDERERKRGREGKELLG